MFSAFFWDKSAAETREHLRERCVNGESYRAVEKKRLVWSFHGAKIIKEKHNNVF
jgi:hypothetical protein